MMELWREKKIRNRCAIQTHTSSTLQNAPFLMQGTPCFMNLTNLPHLPLDMCLIVWCLKMICCLIYFAHFADDGLLSASLISEIDKVFPYSPPKINSRLLSSLPLQTIGISIKNKCSMVATTMERTQNFPLVNGSSLSSSLQAWPEEKRNAITAFKRNKFCIISLNFCESLGKLSLT